MEIPAAIAPRLARQRQATARQRSISAASCVFLLQRFLVFDASLRFDARLHDHLGPARELAPDVGAERFGRTRNDFAGISGEALVHVRLGQYAYDVIVNACDDW